MSGGSRSFVRSLARSLGKFSPSSRCVAAAPAARCGFFPPPPPGVVVGMALRLHRRSRDCFGLFHVRLSRRSEQTQRFQPYMDRPVEAMHPWGFYPVTADNVEAPFLFLLNSLTASLS